MRRRLDGSSYARRPGSGFSVGDELTRREIDGLLILDAAVDAQTLWKETSSDDEPRAIRSSWSFGCPSG